MPNFFIDRPIFAWVITIILCFAGILAIYKLPVEQYPNLAPTTVRISANYPGASAQTLENTVTQTIEQQLTGLDNLLYMSSTSSSAGSVSITLTFETGVDPDKAMQDVQNEVQPILRKLPQEVQQQGIRLRKSGDNTLMMIAFVSKDGSMDKEDIADYIASNLVDPLSRVNGVGSADVFGAQYAMRIWLDPNKLVQYNLTASDIVSAIKTQNAQVSVGELGAIPAVKNQRINATITSQSQLKTADQFRQIILKVEENGATVTLGDVAKVELGSESYTHLTRYNGMPSAGIGISLASGANELQTAELVKAKIAELTPYFPHGLQAKIAYDTSPFVQSSIKDVVITLIEAIFLVFCIMFLFLQNIRATLIPTIAVPVVLLGTFAILSAFHFSINTLTMFAMVLAIGLLVDDAIVVVENVERVMSTEGLSAIEATRKSMKQIQSALVGIALVLSAVFIPMAFFGGTTGAIYRQFSLTIVSSMILSVFVALILTPALCVTLLKPNHQIHDKGFFGWFNRTFEKSRRIYNHGVFKTLRAGKRTFLLYLIILVVLAGVFSQLSTSFLPAEDRGMFMTMVQLAPGSTQQETINMVKKVEQYYQKQETNNIDGIMSIIGSGPGGNGQNVARLFIRLKDWSQRKGSKNSSFAIVERATKYFRQITDAKVMVMNPPAISGLGSSSGFELQLEDHGSLGHQALLDARDKLLSLAKNDPILTRVRENGMDDNAQLQIHIDQRKAQALGISLDDINNTLKIVWGSTYVNDFIDRGRIKKVYVQAAAPFRMVPTDINRWYVRNKNQEMVPFSAFSSVTWGHGPQLLTRFNGYPSLQIVGEAAPGYSTGQAMAEMQKLMSQLPQGIGLDWTGVSYQEKASGQQAPALLVVSLAFIFLCLAALYESWSIPFSIILVVPLGLLGAVIATYLRGLDNDVYFQIGLLTIIGLSAKNAVLIVEFANELYEKGRSLKSAIITAASMRLRPILMTSLAFIFGVLPMALSSSTGAASQHSVGTGVIGGMISATILTVIFVPLFFKVIRGFFPKRKKKYLINKQE